MIEKNHAPRILFCAALLGCLILAGCGAVPRQGTIPVSQPALERLTPTPSNWSAGRVATVNALKTASVTALPTINSPTPTINLTWVAYNLTNPPPTATATPIVDANGNVTWHPQHQLISSSESGGDGVYYYEQSFSLYWDGTLMQPSGNDLGAPYVSKLSQAEICKLLNTAEASGFFEEPDDYNFPFDGAWRGNITVNGWHANSSSAQILDGAISGRPYYDYEFCRTCPIPSQETIIQPGLANMYFLLQNYHPEKRHVAPVEKLHVTFYGTDKPANAKTWPLTSISLAQLWKDCNKDYDCTDSGMIVEGDVAQEIIKKLHRGDVLSEQVYSYSPATKITYEAVWPDVPEVPQNYTMTCNASAGQYPLLPLNRQQKFWYYAPGGKWAAERIEGENKMRVVNTSGYEKVYGYDAKLFGQDSIQVYPRYWSADGQFFYVSVLAGAKTVGLQQIDVKNEKVRYIFIGTEKQSFTYAFSTDSKQLAYIRQGDTPPKLIVADLASGMEKSVYLTSPSIAAEQATIVNRIIWLRNKDKFYLTVIFAQHDNPNTYIFVVDLASPVGMRVVAAGLYQDGMVCDDSGNCQFRINFDTGEVGP